MHILPSCSKCDNAKLQFLELGSYFLEGIVLNIEINLGLYLQETMNRLSSTILHRKVSLAWPSFDVKLVSLEKALLVPKELEEGNDNDFCCFIFKAFCLFSSILFNCSSVKLVMDTNSLTLKHKQHKFCSHNNNN